MEVTFEDIKKQIAQLAEMGITRITHDDKKLEYLNQFIGITHPRYFENGVWSIDLGDRYDSTIRFSYHKNSWETEYIVIFGGKTLPKSTKSRVYRHATADDHKAFSSYLNLLISNRKEELENNSKGPSFYEFADKCVAYTNEYLAKAYPDYKAILSYGNTQSDKHPRLAIVLYYKGNKDPYFQKGYISLYNSDFKDFSYRLSSCGIKCSGKFGKWQDYPKVIKENIDWLMN